MSNQEKLRWPNTRLATNAEELINNFALVTYLPPQLGNFLDRLRCELVPNAIPRAHITILPPRPLFIPPQQGWSEICHRIKDLQPFEIELTEVEMFHSTSVLYIGLGAGRGELERLHDSLNVGPLASDELFSYHPHVTLAQGLPLGPAGEACELARRRWAEFRGNRRFALEVITFVQNTIRNEWVDVAQHTVAPLPSVL